MIIKLDLKKSINNYLWSNKENLENYIKNIQDELWKMYEQTQDIEEITDEQRNRLYDILDFFTKYEIEEKKEM